MTTHPEDAPEEVAWKVAEEIVRQNHDPKYCLSESPTAIFDMDGAVRVIAAALCRYAGDVPEGWRLVPVELTMDMRAAAVNTTLPGIGEPPLYEKIWRAMIAAAPAARAKPSEKAND